MVFLKVDYDRLTVAIEPFLVVLRAVLEALRTCLSGCSSMMLKRLQTARKSVLDPVAHPRSRAFPAPFSGSAPIQRSDNILSLSRGIIRLSRDRVASIFFRDSYFWYQSCSGVIMELPLQHPVSIPPEAIMSAKRRRKIYGVRRESRRPRGWTRWFQEGLLETESAGSIRLRTVLWGQK
jgi:hypothetical protein